MRIKFLLIPVALYLVFAAGLVFVQRPNPDETPFSSAAITFIQHGYMGIPKGMGITSKEFDLQLDKYVYIHPPFGILAQAAWMKVFGIGLFNLRFMAVFFGLLGLLAWYKILEKLGVDKKAILLILIMIALEFNYNRRGAEGRVLDIMCSALAFSAWASYLSFREKRFAISLFLSGACIVMSGLTHPNGIIGLFGLVFLVLYYDRRNLNIKNIAVFLVPFLIGAAGWGAYILQNVEVFKTQIRWQYLSATGFHPGLNLQTVMYDIKSRYLLAYGYIENQGFPIYSVLPLFILLMYFFSVVFTGINAAKTRKESEPEAARPERIIFALTMICFLSLMFLSSHKWTYHLCLIVPLFAACTGIFWAGLKAGSFPKHLLTAAVIISMALSSGVNFYRFKRNSYFRDYAPYMKKIVREIRPQDTVIGPSYAGFLFGFERVSVDFNLGRENGNRPEYIIIDPEYTMVINGYKSKDPKLYAYTQKVLSAEYLIFDDGPLFKVYKLLR
ncbi:MAG: hypothetical protein A2297_06430 [Elusimicrobia bacterium RIFOXYB2_FULL_48_7]|nr:MAG: hypothetical protein A2297_06430 [Elusimicrobia bacterium RIFOXYB2_FULL_48_7]